MDNPADRDKALLERLNALKKSSVRFHTTTNPLQDPQQEPQHVTDITARFRNLKDSRNTDSKALITEIAEAPLNADEASPSPTVEELLADLGPEEQWKVNQDETTQIHTLLEEAKKALPASSNQGKTGHESTEKATNVPGSQKDHDDPNGLRRTSTTSSANDEEEAALQLQRILEELDLEHTDPLPSIEEPPSNHPDRRSPSVPSIPQTDLPKPTPTKSNSTEANNPFPSVPLDLPSVPKTIKTSSVKRSDSPGTIRDGFTDAEISSWCVICCADAVVRCTGCAGELYCWGCWGEGHRGEEVGFEERYHRWTGVGSWKGAKGGGGGGARER
ncbi:MAG: hypothetical protein Q9166_002671 [cf. Caloplaca sp. 2 TL-2023]